MLQVLALGHRQLVKSRGGSRCGAEKRVVLKIKRTKERADDEGVSMVGFFGPEQKELVQMMYGSASEDYLLLLESLGDFFEKEIEPTARQIDVKAEFPRENIRKLFEQGFTSMGFPKDYGGLELPWPIYVAAMEMCGKACASTALSLAIHGTCCEGVRQFSNPSPKKEYLPQMISGKKMLFGGRVTVGAISTGIARAAFDKAVKYSKDRTAFGKPLSEFEMIQSKLADMLTDINASRMMVYRAAYLKDQGKPFELEAAQAKVFASEHGLRVCDEAIQIHGGYGYADEFDVHRHWRDSRLNTVGEGTSEIMRLIISKHIIKG